MDAQDINLITGRILKVAYAVLNDLGEGFLEKVYANAMWLGFREEGLASSRHVPMQVSFRGRVVGDFQADFVVEGVVLVEIKAVRAIAPEHVAQVINYLKASGLQVGQILNFGHSKLEIRRLLNGQLQ